MTDLTAAKIALTFPAAPPLVAGATTFLHGKACHWILARPRAPYESSSLATPLKRWDYGRWALVFICAWNSSEGKPYNRAAPVGNAPLLVLRTTSPKGKHVTGFSGRFAPLQIQFLCHPGGGSFSGAMLCDAYEFIGSLRVVVPPHSGGTMGAGHFGQIGPFKIAPLGATTTLSRQRRLSNMRTLRPQAGPS